MQLDRLLSLASCGPTLSSPNLRHLAHPGNTVLPETNAFFSTRHAFWFFSSHAGLLAWCSKNGSQQRCWRQSGIRGWCSSKWVEQQEWVNVCLSPSCHLFICTKVSLQATLQPFDPFDSPGALPLICALIIASSLPQQALCTLQLWNHSTNNNLHEFLDIFLTD